MFLSAFHPLRLILVAEVAQISVDFIADNNLHQNAPTRTVSPATAHLLTGGLIVPLSALFIIACMAAASWPVLRDIVLPGAAIGISLAKTWLTTGTYGVQLFLELATGYLILTIVVTAIFSIRFSLIRLAIIVSVLFLATAMVSRMLVPA